MEDAEAAVLRSMEAYEIKCDQELKGEKFDDKMQKKFGVKI